MDSTAVMLLTLILVALVVIGLLVWRLLVASVLQLTLLDDWRKWDLRTYQLMQETDDISDIWGEDEEETL